MSASSRESFQREREILYNPCGVQYILSGAMWLENKLTKVGIV